MPRRGPRDRPLKVTANVSRDIGFQFLRLGTAIEQADMTTRIIDAA
ncbi:alpha-E domain-containing protein [Pantoea ananatis]